MATVTVRIPNGRQTFATRARKRAGMGSFFARVPTPPLPAGGGIPRGMSSYFSNPNGPLPPNQIFGPLARGIGAYFSKPGGPLPPNQVFGPLARGMGSFFSGGTNPPLPARGVFAPFSRGLRSFFIKPTQQPPLPAPSVFAGYANPSKCMTCKKRCFRRKGMGQDNGINYAYNLLGVDPGIAPTVSVPNDLGLDLGSNDIAPTYDVPSDLGTSLVPQGGPVTSPSTFTATTSTNPSLDAYNQALTNAAATNPALTNPNTLGTMSAAVGTATPAQLASATTALNAMAASTPSLTQQISNWLAGSTVISGVSNSTVAFGGAAAIVLLSALASKKKGKR